MNPVALIGRRVQVIEGPAQSLSPNYRLSCQLNCRLPAGLTQERLVMLTRKGPHLESSEPVATRLPERAVLCTLSHRTPASRIGSATLRCRSVRNFLSHPSIQAQ